MLARKVERCSSKSGAGIFPMRDARMKLNGSLTVLAICVTACLKKAAKWNAENNVLEHTLASRT